MEQTVLGHLAGTDWFGRHGEVALTGGLAFCLRKDPAAGTGLLDLVHERTNVAIAGPLTWQAESASEGGRVDIDAVKEGTHAPVLRIEGKVFAPFEDRQVSSYVTDQLDKLSDCDIDAGVLAVVVPESRARRVAREVAALLVAECDAHWAGEHLLVVAAGASVTVCILTWDAVFEAAESSAGAAKEDIRQLLGACRALDGADVPALTDGDLSGAWTGRAGDVQKIVYRVTEFASELLGQPVPYPAQTRPPFDGAYRYLGKGQPMFAVGRRAGNTAHPVWAAWLPNAARGGAIEARLRQAGFAPVPDDAGYLWVPLDIEALPPGRPATGQIVLMAEEAARIWDVAQAAAD